MAENNNEVAKVAINDIGTEEDFIKAVDSTIKNFDDGDLVEGTVVKIDHDEVLLDIGYKTEGVIPSRELSIKKDVDPDEVVEVGDTIEALVVAARSNLVVRQVPVAMRPRAGGTPSQNPLKAAKFLGRAFVALGISLTRPTQRK